MPIRVAHIVESSVPQAGSLALSLPGLYAALRDEVESVIVGADTAADAARIDADVCHVHGWDYELARTVFKQAASDGRPVVVSPVGGLGDRPYEKKSFWQRLRTGWGGDRLIGRAAAVIAQNECERREISARLTGARVVVLPYGLDVSEYGAHNEPSVQLPPTPQERVLLMLGPVHPAEGCVPLLKAFAELGRDAADWCVVLAGPCPGDWRKMLEAAVFRKGGQDLVLFADAPDAATQRAWISRASILAAPSLGVRCGVSVLQAMAGGLAVVASEGATPCGAEASVNVCPPQRDELRKTLGPLLTRSPEELDAMGEAGKECVRSNLDWSVLRAGYLDLYRSLV